MVRFAIRIVIACCAVCASAAEVGMSASPEFVREYRRPVAKWPPFEVDEGVVAKELGELPPLAPEPWHTPACTTTG